MQCCARTNGQGVGHACCAYWKGHALSARPVLALEPKLCETGAQVVQGLAQLAAGQRPCDGQQASGQQDEQRPIVLYLVFVKIALFILGCIE